MLLSHGSEGGGFLSHLWFGAVVQLPVLSGSTGGRRRTGPVVLLLLRVLLSLFHAAVGAAVRDSIGG